MKRTLASLALTLFVAGSMLVGCGDDTTNTTTGGANTPIALDNLSKELAESYCELAFSCCSSMEQMTLFKDLPSVPTNVAECTTSFASLYDMYILNGIKAGVEAGRLKYDGVLAGSCFSQVAGDCSALSGEGVQPTDPACDKVFVGLVADGGDCAQSNECSTAGAYCAKAQGAMMGKCEAPAKEGESCDVAFCADGLVCDFGAMAPTCIKPVADGQMCSGDFVCVSGNCDTATGMCAPKKAIGESCSGFSQCKDAYCDFQTSLCTAKKDDGAACMAFDECKSYECNQDMKCGSSGPLCTGM